MSFIAEKLRKEFQAVKSRFTAQRNVPPEISKQQIKDEIPVTWEKDDNLYGYVSTYMLKGSGAGFVTPPSPQFGNVFGESFRLRTFPNTRTCIILLRTLKRQSMSRLILP